MSLVSRSLLTLVLFQSVWARSVSKVIDNSETCDSPLGVETQALSSVPQEASVSEVIPLSFRCYFSKRFLTYLVHSTTTTTKGNFLQ
jgi:hypothetical protein